MSTLPYEPGVYLFPLLAALFWGVSPVLSKRALAHGASPLLGVIIAVFLGVVIYLPVLVFSQNSGHLFEGVTFLGAGVFLFSGVLNTTIGQIASYTGVYRVGASINNAVVHLSPLFATVFAVFLLGEAMTLPLAVGILLLVGGLSVLGFSRGGDLRGWDRRDLWVPLAAALAYGLGNVVRRFGFTETSITTLQGIVLNNIAALAGLLGFVLLFRGTRVFHTSIENYGYFAATGLLVALGLLALFEGLAIGPVAIVIPLSSVAPLVTIVFTRLLLQDLERVTVGVVLGATLIVVGASIVAVV